MSGKPYVISIAAVSGGGKTTITHQLLDELNNSKALYFDDYNFEDCPDDICEWVERGADYNAWNLSPLINDIQLNLKNKSVDYLILDYPFASLNFGISEFINLSIFIDTPLDIAMARRILRDYKENPIEDVRNDLNNYLSCGRNAYLEMQRNVKPNSNIVIDGSLPYQTIVNLILEELRHRGLELAH